MFRPTLHAAKGARFAPRIQSRGNHDHVHMDGPEQHIFKRSRLTIFAITSAFIGLIWYDKFYASPLIKGNSLTTRTTVQKSSIGDWLIPNTPTREEVYAHEEMMAKKALKAREERQILFSADNTRTNLEENIRTFPVPEVEGRSIRPGITIDLDKIEERRPRTVYYAKRKEETE
ncbi:hypothetical protein TRVA0_011S02366 [Trichomonascus vanleenenianus]|uniref:uncharacterized protein n=1 Tax=Trichomonascus vanleenenianus TaxID=2268995 RepID=UPI003ECA3EE7